MLNLTILAQIENKNNTIKFEVIEDDFKTPAGLELPAIKLPSIIKPQNLFKATDFSGLGEKTSETLDITHEDDYLDLKTDEHPSTSQKIKQFQKNLVMINTWAN